jgi:quercetin dioxygenase-like cupin family protein
MCAIKTLEGGITWLGVQYKTILTTDESGGAISVTESISPAGSGPPRHIHQKEDESFVLLTGACDFWQDGVVHSRRAGESFFVPRGTNHTFKVTSAEPCHHLTILTPGGFEGFFAEMAKGQFRIPEDMAKIAEIGAAYNLSLTGPPL